MLAWLVLMFSRGILWWCDREWPYTLKDFKINTNYAYNSYFS